MVEEISRKFPSLFKLLFWLVIIKISSFFAMQVFNIGLVYDEAQYWTWSKDLSFGYYSKPPGIAWQIAFGTSLFGDTEVGVRFGALLFSFALSLAVYFLARASGLEERFAFWASIALSVTPLGIFSSFIATTDVPFLLFWTLAAAFFSHALLAAKAPPFLSIGLMIGLGALFKWPIYLLWIPILGFSLWHKRLSFSFVFGLLISLLGLVPSLFWNARHDFATFQHVFRSIAPQALGGGGHPNPLEFFAAQFAIISPIYGYFLVVATCVLAINLRKLPLSISFLWWTSISIFFSVLILACFKKVQANWAVATYPSAFVMLFAYVNMAQERVKTWLKAGTILSLLLVAIAFGSSHVMPYTLNIFHDMMGWKPLSKGLLQAGYNPKTQFLFCDRYQTASILSFYGPEQKRSYFLNLRGVRKNQFSYWPQMSDEQIGKDGFYVSIVEGYGALQKALQDQLGMKHILRGYFREVSAPLVVLPLLEVGSEVVKVAVLIRCEGYNGAIPPESNKY
jgi:4-amino-4-deoxy-L-arabinose transferase-like glycosyltransferase